jgi:hypothetical protein
MRRLHAMEFGFPKFLPGHSFARGFPAYVVAFLGQMLARQCRSKISITALEQFDHLARLFGGDLPVRGRPSQQMNDGAITLGLHASE